MDFSLTDDQVMIRDSAQGFLADVSDSSAVRKAIASEQGFDADVWRRIGEELGWCAPFIPEEHGGLGLGPVEVVLLLEQMGRYLLCAPFFSTVCLATNLLLQLGGTGARAKYLPLIAEGKLQATAPLPSATDWSDAAASLQAKESGKQWTLDGRVARIPDGASAGVLLLLAKVNNGLGLFAATRDSKGLKLGAHQQWDGTRRFADIELKAVVAERIDEPGKILDGLARATALARLFIAAEQLGCAQQCLDLTVAYTSGRKQFGRVIASFQAVKHRCAEMMVRIEGLRSAVYGAAAFAAGNAATQALEMECAMTRVLAADTLFFCAQEAIQLHGGVGFTLEYDPQLYFKRAQASSHWLGTADALREVIAQSLIDKVA